MRPTDELEPALLFAALDHGVPALSAEASSRDVRIAAAGTWGRYGSVVAVRRDPAEDDALLADVYLLERSPAGAWQPPTSCSGSGLPEWVLDRLDGPLPDAYGSDLLNLGAQMAHVGGHWLAELTVVASRAVTRIEVRYGGEVLSVPVPPIGVVTVPGLVRAPDDVAEFRGFDDAGRLRSVQHYRPLTEADRELSWPDAALWAS